MAVLLGAAVPGVAVLPGAVVLEPGAAFVVAVVGVAGPEAAFVAAVVEVAGPEAAFVVAAV